MTTDTQLTPPAHGQYWPGQGGHYICTMPALLGVPARHLVASVQETKATYGRYLDLQGASCQVDGVGNTAALLAHAESHPAAVWCKQLTADGHTDFHLPSKLEMIMASICAPALFSKQGWYWTSTQNSRLNAFLQDFEHGFSGWLSKLSQHRVRAFRWVYLA